MKLICANRDTHEEILFKTYKQLRHLNIKETTQSNRGTRFKWTFLQRRHRDGHRAREKMLSICKYYRTVNQKQHHLTHARTVSIENLQQ